MSPDSTDTSVIDTHQSRVVAVVLSCQGRLANICKPLNMLLIFTVRLFTLGELDAAASFDLRVAFCRDLWSTCAVLVMSAVRGISGLHAASDLSLSFSACSVAGNNTLRARSCAGSFSPAKDSKIPDTGQVQTVAQL